MIENKKQLDRGLLYGDGFFTTIRVADNKIHRWPLHLERICFSAQRLKFIELDGNKILQELSDFIAQQPEADGALRLTITRGANGVKKRGYSIPSKPKYKRYLSWAPINSSNLEKLKEGVSLSISETPISQNKVLAGIKHLNRLDQVLASEEITESCFDSIMFNGKFLISGTKSNIYFYLNNRWLTPKLNKAGVNGTVRRWLLETQTNVHESKFGLEILSRAQYCLVSNAIVGIIPVTQVQLANKNVNFEVAPGLIKLQEEYNKVIVTY